MPVAEGSERMVTMTSAEKVAWLESLPRETISPAELAKIEGGTPFSYNVAAKEGRLSLPHQWNGRNLRIWKGPVIELIMRGRRITSE